MSKKDTERILKILEKNWVKVSMPKIKNVKIIEIEENKNILVIDTLVAIFTVNDQILPFLGKTEILDKFPAVTVDSGSIRFICNGAKVLRPGIVNFDSFKKDDIVVVKDEKYKKYLAVGTAIEDSLQAQSMPKGPIINNIHYVGDKFWNAFKEISFRL